MPNFCEISWYEIDDEINNLYQGMKTSLAGSDAGGNQEFRMKDTNTGLQFGNQKATRYTIKMELLEDIDFEISSDFDTAESDIPFAGLLTTIGRYTSLMGGQSPEILNLFKVPTWKSTNPLSISLQPLLYTRVHSLLDVELPAFSLSSLTALKKNSAGGYTTPGVYMGNLGAALNRQQQAKQQGNTTSSPPPAISNSAGVEDPPKNSTDTAQLNKVVPGFIQVRIPGLLKLQTAMLVQCKPKFSKQKTESGGSLWCVLDMKIQTALPASSDEIFNELKSTYSRAANTTGITSTEQNNPFSL